MRGYEACCWLIYFGFNFFPAWNVRINASSVIDEFALYKEEIGSDFHQTEFKFRVNVIAAEKIEFLFVFFLCVINNTYE